MRNFLMTRKGHIALNIAVVCMIIALGCATVYSLNEWEKQQSYNDV